MRVNCFTMKRPMNNPIDIDVLYKEFGDNIPKYNPLEGGDYLGPEYLCCVDANVDIKVICDKYNYILREIYKMDIDSSKYNSNYYLHETWFGHSSVEPYYLDRVDRDIIFKD